MQACYNPHRIVLYILVECTSLGHLKSLRLTPIPETAAVAVSVILTDISHVLEEKDTMPVPGPLELVIILVIVAMLFGVGKLPEVFGAVGKGIREFRKESAIDEDSSSTDDAPAANNSADTAEQA